MMVVFQFDDLVKCIGWNNAALKDVVIDFKRVYRYTIAKILKIYYI